MTTNMPWLAQQRSMDLFVIPDNYLPASFGQRLAKQTVPVIIPLNAPAASSDLSRGYWYRG
jgi:hypothetical protein